MLLRIAKVHASRCLVLGVGAPCRAKSENGLIHGRAIVSTSNRGLLHDEPCPPRSYSATSAALLLTSAEDCRAAWLVNGVPWLSSGQWHASCVSKASSTVVGTGRSAPLASTLPKGHSTGHKRFPGFLYPSGIRLNHNDRRITHDSPHLFLSLWRQWSHTSSRAPARGGRSDAGGELHATSTQQLQALSESK